MQSEELARNWHACHRQHIDVLQLITHTSYKALAEMLHFCIDTAANAASRPPMSARRRLGARLMSPALTSLQNKLSLVSISWALPDTDCRNILRTAEARAIPMHPVGMFVAIKRWI